MHTIVDEDDVDEVVGDEDDDGDEDEEDDDGGGNFLFKFKSSFTSIILFLFLGIGNGGKVGVVGSSSIGCCTLFKSLFGAISVSLVGGNGAISVSLFGGNGGGGVGSSSIPEINSFD